ncbi:hypothetical protein [Streptomyces chartreusis]|uniref:hypothetical protein n=1 Tax=Streptomyces chartreusis TaxID=1969 RepID=UPI0033BEA561
MSRDTRGGWLEPKEGPKRQRPLKRARVGWPPALRNLKELLYEVYLAAGAPSLDEITADIAADDVLMGSPSRDTVHRVITDGQRSGQQADVVAVATVLARRAAWDAPDLAGRVRELWVQAMMAQGAGRPIGELHGDVRLLLDGGLGVHPALDAGGARDRFGILPTYVPRDHDARLKEVVDVAKAGRSGIAVLVGGSSTGKTRALWEAVRGLPEGWRLWHPLSPTAPDAALAALPDIAPKTVVWLNEAQHYLSPDPLGERVAAGLRELLHDPTRAPVLVLGTLWPEHWDILTARTTSDRHAGARELLGRHKIDVPDAFTPADLAALDATEDADPRLTQAAEHAKGAQVTQYLAGVPYLMDRYDAARGATRALIHAAMDARRLGAGLHIPLDWLADAAPGYLDDAEYHILDGDWLSKALAYVTTPCNGIPGILTLVTISGPRNQRTRRRTSTSGTLADRPVPKPQGPQYLLADYLDQHGRRHRAEIIPPIDFWTAAAHHAHTNDLAALGNAAWNRGLYRDAAQLHKNATAHGDPLAAAALVRHLHTLRPTDHHPARWAAAHAALDNPRAVVQLVQALRDAGAVEQVTALLARNPAAHAALDNPGDIGWLIAALRDAGAVEQVTVLAERVAGQAALDNSYAVATLLSALRDAGAVEQVTALLARNPAAHAALDNPGDVAMLLDHLRRAGAVEQVTVLAARAAANAAVDNPHAVATLLEALREAGAVEQVRALAERAAAHAAVDNPGAVGALLERLQQVRAKSQFTVLAERAAAHVALDNVLAVSALLEELGKAWADEQVTALAARAAANTALDEPYGVARLLEALRKVWGANRQVTALLTRNPAAHAALDEPFSVARLLEALRGAGAEEQVTTLLARNPATHAALDWPLGVARLLEALRGAGAEEQVTALLARNPAAHTTPDNPGDVATLLEVLRGVGADEQVTVLAERVAAHVALDNVLAVRVLLEWLQGDGAHEQVTVLAERIAAHAALDFNYSHSVGALLKRLRGVGAHDEVTILLERLPAAGLFDLFINLGGNRKQFRLGREPDGSAAPRWTWNDLD